MRTKLIFKIQFFSIVSFMVLGCNNDSEYDEYFSSNYSMAKPMMTRSNSEGYPGEEPASSYSYPTQKEIMDDPTVKSKMEELWQQTKAYANKDRRCEFGVLIFQNRKDMTFYFSSVIQGKDARKGEKASITFPTCESPELVAAFHAHTTYQYCDSTMSRANGPSLKDLNGSYASLMPCFVYDYDEPVCGGDSKDRPAHIYSYGQNSRVTHL